MRSEGEAEGWWANLGTTVQAKAELGKLWNRKGLELWGIKGLYCRSLRWPCEHEMVCFLLSQSFLKAIKSLQTTALETHVLLVISRSCPSTSPAQDHKQFLEKHFPKVADQCLPCSQRTCHNLQTSVYYTPWFFQLKSRKPVSQCLLLPDLHL